MSHIYFQGLILTIPIAIILDILCSDDAYLDNTFNYSTPDMSRTYWWGNLIHAFVPMAHESGLQS